MSAQSVYPVAGFYFQVKVGTEAYSFKEVSGISSEINTEEIAEGGENRFKYKVPTVTKYTNLELKRGVVAKNSNLLTWVNNSLSQGFSKPIKPKKLEVSLLNREGDIIMLWDFVGAWPVGWSTANLDAMNNEVLIETLSFSYNYFTSKIIKQVKK
ncbi:phage tail protein [Lacinutrix chionoecetis]